MHKNKMNNKCNPWEDEPMNAPNTNVAQRGEVNEQHQNVAKLVVQRDPIALSTIHLKTT
jgi:hypothetical protein